jgi:hypothetical protein
MMELIFGRTSECNDGRQRSFKNEIIDGPSLEMESTKWSGVEAWILVVASTVNFFPAHRQMTRSEYERAPTREQQASSRSE